MLDGMRIAILAEQDVGAGYSHSPQSAGGFICWSLLQLFWYSCGWYLRSLDSHRE